MLNFDKITDVEMNELKQIIIKNIEKSELERYFLFSGETTEKAKLFVLGYRLLLNAYNIIEDSTLRKELKNEIIISKQKYKDILGWLEDIDMLDYGKNNRMRKLFYGVNSKEVNDLIDLFSILVERVNIINVSRFKGVVLEGKSGEAYKKIFTEVK